MKIIQKSSLSRKYSDSTPSSPDPLCSHMIQYSAQSGVDESGPFSKYLQDLAHSSNLTLTRMLTLSLYPFLLLFSGLLLFGCGGVSTDKPDSPEQTETAPIPAGKRIPVRIAPVENHSGEAQYDTLCHYLHIKTAQLLNQSGRYEVLADDLGTVLPDIQPEQQLQAEQLFHLSIQDVKEQSGGTVSIAIFSTQKKSAKVGVALRLLSLPGNRLIDKSTGSGYTDKGAWGILAKVERSSMLEGKGFWQLDDSMLGIAATRGLKKAIAALQP